MKREKEKRRMKRGRCHYPEAGLKGDVMHLRHSSLEE
jgi:hypothetical protein